MFESFTVAILVPSAHGKKNTRWTFELVRKIRSVEAISDKKPLRLVQTTEVEFIDKIKNQRPLCEELFSSIEMSNLASQLSEHCSSNEIDEALAREPGSEGQECCHEHDFDKTFAFPLDDTTSVIAQADVDTESYTVWLTNCKLVTVERSSKLDDNEHKCVSNGEVRSDSSLEQQKTATEKSDYRLQPLHEAQNFNQPDSSDLFTVSVAPLLPLIKKQGYLNGPQCERIMEQLELLQDNGRFGEHESLVTSYLQRCGSGEYSDLELALKIERGVAFSYHKEFKNSKRMFVSVINSEKDRQLQLRNPNILTARAYFLLAADYRSRKFVKLSPLFEFLRRSQCLLQNHDSPEDWAELYYNYGSVWLVYMSMIPDDERNATARNTARQNARHYYEQAICSCKRDSRVRVQVKKQTYIHLKLAALLLDCSSTAARTRHKSIASDDIKEAKEHLDFVQYQLGVCIPTGTRVQLLKTRSDQFYRQGIYQLAKETAEEALTIAVSNGFYTERENLQERIDFVEKLCEEQIRIIDVNDISSSNSETCPSESADSD